jgi:hypothetical protein
MRGNIKVCTNILSTNEKEKQIIFVIHNKEKEVLCLFPARVQQVFSVITNVHFVFVFVSIYMEL